MFVPRFHQHQRERFGPGCCQHQILHGEVLRLRSGRGPEDNRSRSQIGKGNRWRPASQVAPPGSLFPSNQRGQVSGDQRQIRQRKAVGSVAGLRPGIRLPRRTCTGRQATDAGDRDPQQGCYHQPPGPDTRRGAICFHLFSRLRASVASVLVFTHAVTGPGSGLSSPGRWLGTTQHEGKRNRCCCESFALLQLLPLRLKVESFPQSSSGCVSICDSEKRRLFPAAPAGRNRSLANFEPPPPFGFRPSDFPLEPNPCKRGAPFPRREGTALPRPAQGSACAKGRCRGQGCPASKRH